MVGRTLSQYRILEKIGSGGMGEVFLAEDEKLHRRVAIKMLPPFLASDPKRLARLEREAHLLAQLSHPGVATLHDLEASDGAHFLVMELVPGETLAERIRRKPIPIGECLALFRQIADALEAAHERGIVHRDLKPGNIKITPDDRVKILDFGLAKALHGGAGDLAIEGSTMARISEVGVIEGTVPYLSPEQARGGAVDRRTDIWAFGCCLYEALTGRAAFPGETASDTIAAILDRDPDWSVLPEAAPERLRRLLHRCLRKDLRRRLQHIGDARLELEEMAASPAEPVGRERGTRAGLTLAAAFLVGALGAGAAGWILRGGEDAPSLPVTRWTLPLTPGPEGELRLDPDSSCPFAVAPDGLRLVYSAIDQSGRSRLYVRELDGFQTRALPGTESAQTLFLSPDGRWVGFRAEGKLKEIRVSGGAPLDIAPTSDIHTVVWGPADEIVLDAGYPPRLWRIAGGSSEPVEIPVVRRGVQYVRPAGFTTDGGLLVSPLRPGETSVLEVLSIESGERRALVRSGRSGSARLLPTGHVLYFERPERSIRFRGERSRSAAPRRVCLPGGTRPSPPSPMESNGSSGSSTWSEACEDASLRWERVGPRSGARTGTPSPST